MVGRKKICRRAVAAWTMMMAVSAMTVGAEEETPKGFLAEIQEETQAEVLGEAQTEGAEEMAAAEDGSGAEYQNITITLQEIVDANTGIEKILGDHERIGCTEIEYDASGKKKSTEQFAVTRDGGSYILAFVKENYILTYKNGSAWIKYMDGSKQVQAVDPVKYQQMMEWVENLSTVGYSETEKFTAQTEQDGKIYLQSEDPGDDGSVDGKTTCFYYVLDEDTLQAERIIESIRDEDGEETKVQEMILEYGD